MAWVANKEYALNGLKVQDDWEVLRQIVRIWNRAHDSSSYIDLPFVSKPSVDKPHQCPPASPFGGITAPCTPVTGCPNVTLPPLFQTINLFNYISPTAENASFLTSAGLRVNTGPLKTAAIVPPPSSPIVGPSGGAVASIKTVAGHGAVFALGGLATGLAYAFISGRTAEAVFGSAWSQVQSMAKQSLSAVDRGVRLPTSLKEGRRR